MSFGDNPAYSASLRLRVNHRFLCLQSGRLPAICPPGSRVDVCVRSPGQVRKEAAQVNCDGSLGSFFHPIFGEAAHDIRERCPYLNGHG